MIVDLHAHYPMHLVPRGRLRVWRLLRSQSERLRLRDRIRAILIDLIASPVANYRSLLSGPRVRIGYLRKGGVGVALSVLYSFFDEADAVGDPLPQPDYLQTVLRQLDDVRRDIEANHRGDAFIATDPAALRSAEEGEVALVHCVEGGFHLGRTTQAVTDAVQLLAGHGVAYITLAHLIWRGIATDAPALPFLTDEQYRSWLPQPDEGLSELGRAAVEAMHRERVLIDLSHMSERSLHETLDLLHELDADSPAEPGRPHPTPVLATHTGFRFGSQEYLLDRAAIERIAERDGVIGLIFARHQLEDGPPPTSRRRMPRVSKRKRFEDSFETLRAHIDRICEITGEHRHVAIGSDLDGFIKPTLAGLEDMRDMARLERALVDHYGEATARAICSENALRPLTAYWRGSAEGPE
jgi:microsomal dipeptidase-like Zn-dependent dipeptidase